MNPTMDVFQKRVAALEKGVAALAAQPPGDRRSFWPSATA